MARIAPLPLGRTVYLPSKDEVKRLEHHRVVGWAEGIGIISINRNALAESQR